MAKFKGERSGTEQRFQWICRFIPSQDTDINQGQIRP